jgi:ATP synthase protein I
MTSSLTSSRGTPRSSGVGVLLRGAGATAVLGLAAGVVGWAVAGAPAGLGVLVGVGLVLAVCVGGSLLVNAVAGVMPTASLLVALLTYTLQVLVLLLAFLGLERSGLLEGDLARGWVGGGAVAATLAWLVAQVWLTMRSRVPAYDLGPEGGER